MDVSHSVAEAVLSASSDAIIAADKDGIIVFWNPGAARIFGHQSADAIGHSLDIIIPERLRKRHWDGYRHVVEGGQSRYGAGDLLTVPGITKEGAGLSIEFTIVPLRNGTGELTGLAAIMRDVASRFEEVRTLKRKLADAQRPVPDAGISQAQVEPVDPAMKTEQITNDNSPIESHSDIRPVANRNEHGARGPVDSDNDDPV